MNLLIMYTVAEEESEASTDVVATTWPFLGSLPLLCLGSGGNRTPSGNRVVLSARLSTSKNDLNELLFLCAGTWLANC